jgi:glutathione peroxidase
LTHKSFFDFTALDAKGKSYPLSQHQGKTILVVNVASRCGLTPQYEGLEALYQKFKDKGLVILGFPCNQFGLQEPGSNDEIQAFCQTRYDVSFPVLGKIEVNGPKAAPIYEFLKSSAPGFLGTKAIKWNFTKFLVGPDGQVIKRYSPQTTPEQIERDLEANLY